MKKVAESKNSKEVCIDLENSHAATHVAENPELLILAKEVIPHIELKGEEVAIQYDVGRIVGKMDLVRTSDSDEIIYAKRKNRDTFTRFAKNREPQDTSFVTLIFRKTDKIYELWSMWKGVKAPSFPGDERETKESKPFWSNHALVWGAQEIQPGTETTICPW